MLTCTPPARLLIDCDAIAANWQALRKLSGGAPAGAAVKANAYGLGLGPVCRRLAREGCTDFFVATLFEGEQVRRILPDVAVHVLHGFTAADIPTLLQARLTPVINTPAQAQLWQQVDAACSLMIDTGMNRLGLRPEHLGAITLDDLEIDIVMSHLACADDAAHPMNALQRTRFQECSTGINARRRSLANSAGACLGPDYALDLTRPGLGLYGGLPSQLAQGHIVPVVRVQAPVLQVKTIPAGETVGYGATWQAATDTHIATLGIGYADGFPRLLSGQDVWVVLEGRRCPLIGRVSMDLICIDAGDAEPAIGSLATVIGGDALSLEDIATRTGLAAYEVLTGLGERFDRHYSGGA